MRLARKGRKDRGNFTVYTISTIKNFLARGIFINSIPCFQKDFDLFSHFCLWVNCNESLVNIPRTLCLPVSCLAFGSEGDVGSRTIATQTDKGCVRGIEAAETWGVTILEWKEIIVQSPATDLCPIGKFKFIENRAGENISMIIWIEFQQV